LFRRVAVPSFLAPSFKFFNDLSPLREASAAHFSPKNEGKTAGEV
jgi:hypothetical protein